jgi:subtilisin family serine protease
MAHSAEDVIQAVAVPPIAAPFSPFDEPLLGDSDQLMPAVCRPEGCLENQWYIFRCGIDKAWQQASGKGVTIADIDWGFNPNHQDLKSRIQLARSMLPLTNSRSVTNGLKRDHGTAVLGQVGAQLNRLGMAGIAFAANLWAIQAGSDTITDHSLWARAIAFVCEQTVKGPRVIILEIQTSQGGNIEMSPEINKAIVDAIAANIVVCVPAGNGNASCDAGIDDDGFPIPLTGSIVVGATRYDKLKNIVGASNRGRRVVVYAPGDPCHDLTCALPNDGYRNRFGGTSAAVAKVAGAVALMLEVNPQLTPAHIRDILSRSNIPVVDYQGNQVGVLLDAHQAVSDAADYPAKGNPAW